MFVVVCHPTYSIKNKNHAQLEVACKFFKLMGSNSLLPHDLSIQSAAPPVFGKSIYVVTVVSYV
jgi:hypothetical protein